MIFFSLANGVSEKKYLLTDSVGQYPVHQPDNLGQGDLGGRTGQHVAGGPRVLT